MKKLALIGVVVLVCLPCIAIVGILLNMFWWREYQTKQSFHVYPGSIKVYEEINRFGGNANIRSLVYWTGDSYQLVRTHYRKYFPNLYDVGNSQEQAFAVYKQAEISPHLDQSKPPNLTFVCNYHELYTCVALTIINLERNDLSNLSSNRLNPPPNEIPKYGTVVIYDYFVYVLDHPANYQTR